MATTTKIGKFLGFMVTSSAVLFMLGVAFISCSKGFGPCGPLDGFAALGYLFAVLAVLGMCASFALGLIWLLLCIVSPTSEWAHPEAKDAAIE